MESLKRLDKWDGYCVIHCPGEGVTKNDSEHCFSVGEKGTFVIPLPLLPRHCMIRY